MKGYTHYNFPSFLSLLALLLLLLLAQLEEEEEEEINNDCSLHCCQGGAIIFEHVPVSAPEESEQEENMSQNYDTQ